MRTPDFSNRISSDDCKRWGQVMANGWQSSGMNIYNVIKLAVGTPPGNPEALGSVNGCYSSTQILCINNELCTHSIIDRSLKSMNMQLSGDHDSHISVAFSSLLFLIKKESHVRDKPDR